MRRLGIMAAFLAISLFVGGGCKLIGGSSPISKPVFALQRPAVQAAAESSASARDNWKNYKPADQKAFLEANADNWANLNKVYNPPPEKPADGN